MNKHDFIEKVLSRFAYYTEKDTQGVFYDAYSRVLTKKTDYEKLWDLFCNEYKDKTPPTGVQLKEYAKQCYLASEMKNASKWIHVKVYNPVYKTVTSIDCFPIGTAEEQIIKTYEAQFKCKGFKIIELY